MCKFILDSLQHCYIFWIKGIPRYNVVLQPITNQGVKLADAATSGSLNSEPFNDFILYFHNHRFVIYSRASVKSVAEHSQILVVRTFPHISYFDISLRLVNCSFSFFVYLNSRQRFKKMKYRLFSTIPNCEGHNRFDSSLFGVLGSTRLRFALQHSE